jgi:hypothetical protein
MLAVVCAAVAYSRARRAELKGEGTSIPTPHAQAVKIPETTLPRGVQFSGRHPGSRCHASAGTRNIRARSSATCPLGLRVPSSSADPVDFDSPVICSSCLNENASASIACRSSSCPAVLSLTGVCAIRAHLPRDGKRGCLWTCRFWRVLGVIVDLSTGPFVLLTSNSENCLSLQSGPCGRCTSPNCQGRWVGPTNRAYRKGAPSVEQVIERPL